MRASFHGSGLHDQFSQHSLNSTIENNSLSDDSLSDYLNESSHQSDYEFVDTVHQSPTLNSLVEKNFTDWFVNEANLVDEDDSSVFSFDLTLRAEKYGLYYYTYYYSQYCIDILNSNSYIIHCIQNHGSKQHL